MTYSMVPTLPGAGTERHTFDMSVDRTRREYSVKSRSRVWSAFIAPQWLLRWKLRMVRASIDRIERELANEFAVTETSPMVDELAALIATRDALMKQMTDRGQN